MSFFEYLATHPVYLAIVLCSIALIIIGGVIAIFINKKLDKIKFKKLEMQKSKENTEDCCENKDIDSKNIDE